MNKGNVDGSIDSHDCMYHIIKATSMMNETSPIDASNAWEQQRLRAIVMISD